MPGKVQTRRTVSFRAEVFTRLRYHCELRGVPMAVFVEELVIAQLDQEGASTWSREEALEALGHLQHPEQEAV